MNKQIETDDWYPVYTIEEMRAPDYPSSQDRHIVDIPEDKVEWILKMAKEFSEVQKYLEQLYEGKEG